MKLPQLPTKEPIRGLLSVPWLSFFTGLLGYIKELPTAEKVNQLDGQIEQIGNGTFPKLNELLTERELNLVNNQADLAQEIIDTQVTPALNAAIDDLNAAITVAQDALEAADLQLSNDIASLTTVVDGNVTSITNLNTTVSGHTSNITTLQQTTANQATDLTNLTTTVSGHTSSLSTLNQTTASQAQSITNLNTTVSGHTSSITTLDQTTANQAQSITNLNTTVSGHSTSITTLNQTTANQATDLTNLSTTVGGHTTSISSLTSTTNGLNANYGVTINNNGHVSGFALNSTAAANGGLPTSAFVIQADKFVLIDPGTAYTSGNSPPAANIPFAVIGGVTYIKSANIQDLTIGTNHLGANAVTKLTTEGTGVLFETIPTTTGLLGTITITTPTSAGVLNCRINSHIGTQATNTGINVVGIESRAYVNGSLITTSENGRITFPGFSATRSAPVGSVSNEVTFNVSSGDSVEIKIYGVAEDANKLWLVSAFSNTVLLKK